MVAIGINEIQSYMVTIRGKEYEKTEEQLPKFRERCSLEVTDYLERTDIKRNYKGFLRAEHDRNIKDTALQLEDIDFNARRP